MSQASFDTRGQLRRSSFGESGRLLTERLNDLRRSRLNIGAVTALLWGAAAFAVIMLASVWVDVVLNLSPMLRVLAWISAFAVLCGVGFRIYVRTKNAAHASSLAKQLDETTGSGGEIRSGLDLIPVAGNSLYNEDLTTQLAQIAVQRANSLAHKITPDTVVPLHSVVGSAAALFGVCLIALIAAIVGPRMAITEARRFFNPFGDHAAYSQYTFQLNASQTDVLYGDGVEVTARVDGPSVEQLQLVLLPPAQERTSNIEDAEPLDVLPMFPDPSGEWHASVANVTAPFDMYLRIRRARSELLPINVITVPEIRSVRVEVEPPLYTGEAIYQGPVPAQGIKGLPGTKVRLMVESNRPLSGGVLKFSGPVAVTSMVLSTSAGKDSEVNGEFVIEDSGSVDISVQDDAGQASRGTYTIPIERLQDQSPLVRLLQPKQTSFATPTASIPIGVSAEDDYGIQRCELYRSLNNSRFLPTDLEIPPGQIRRLQTGTVLPLAEYDLQPGDEIRLFVRVEDNDPNGPNAPVGKGSESSIVSIRIISQQDFERAQVQQQGLKAMMNRYQQAERRLESLAAEMQKLKEKLDAADPDSALAEELKKELQQLAEKMQEEADAIEKLSEQPLPIELDEQLSPQLKKMAEQIREMSEQLKKSANADSKTNQQAAEELQNQLDALKKEKQRHNEEAMQPLERMAQVLPLKQAEGEFTQLVQRQRELADRLQSLQDANASSDAATRARMRELEEEQNRIREQLKDLLDRIEEHAESLPDDPELSDLKSTALEFAAAVREAQPENEMASAEQQLNEFNGHQGFEHAQEAARILEQFLSQCNGMGQQAEGACKAKFSPGMGQCMSNSLSQLAPGFGQKSGGMGMGPGGSGGSSSQMSNSQNVGMYGGMPMMDQSLSGMSDSNSDSNGGVFSDPFANGSDENSSGLTGRQTNPAFGGGAWGVPVQYRRQAGRYLQQLADDLDEE